MMGRLLIGRRAGQSVRLRLGDTVVWVTIEDRSAGRTGVLIEAPEDVEIDRNEILPPGEQRREPRRRA